MSLAREFSKLVNLVKSNLGLGPVSLTKDPKISANIICFNNARSIEATLISLRDYVDEIVVVDGGSTDGTLEILEKYHCKVITNKDWQGYRHQRNLCLDNSSGDWILQIDSDEFLSPAFAKNLRELCSSSVYSGYKIYSRWVQEIKRDEAGELEALPYIAKCDNPQRYFPVMRLVRSVPGLHWAKEIHEYMAGLECFYKKTFSPDENYIYHLDVAINDFMTRKTKAEARKAIDEDAVHPEEYLPELYDYPLEIAASSDFDRVQRMI